MVHEELSVFLAEIAYYTEHVSTARKLIERFLQMFPQQNQFYCRAKLLLSQVIDSEAKGKNGNVNIKMHRQAVSEIISALECACLPANVQRYKYLIFNVSLTFWKVVNQFLRPGRAKCFATDFGKIVNALEQQDDPDKEWRILLLSAAAFCFDDDKQAKTAIEYVDKAIEIAEGVLGATSAVEEKLLARLNACKKESDDIMSAFRKIEEREELMHKPRKIDPDVPEEEWTKPNDEWMKLPPLDGLAAEGYDRVKVLLDESQHRKSIAEAELKEVVDKKGKEQEGLTKLYMQRIYVNPSDSKRFSTLPQVVKSIRTNTMVQLQMVMSNCVPEKEIEPLLAALTKKLEDLPSSAVKCETLLDVCRTAWYLKQKAIALRCFQAASLENSVAPVLRVKLDVCEAQKQLAILNDDGESVNQAVKQRLSAKQMEGYKANQRIEALKILERSVNICLNRVQDPFLIQEICLLMWNNIIPLVQSHLLLKIYSCLKCIAGALKEVSSPFAMLRAQVHYELSKCEEMTDFVSIAKDEAKNSIESDYGTVDYSDLDFNVVPPDNVQLDRNRPFDVTLLPYFELLNLRSSVFDAPSDVEGKVYLWLQQAKENKSKGFMTDMLTKSLYCMLDEINKKDVPGAASLSRRDSLGGDLSLMLMTKGPLTIPWMELDEIENILRTPRTVAAGSAVEKFQVFTKLQQKRCIIMTTIAQLAHMLRAVDMFQQSAAFVLSQTWDTQDTMISSLVDAQIQLYYLFAESLLERLTKIEVKATTLRSSSMDDAEGAADVRNPKALGLVSAIATDEMMTIKRLVVLCFEKGISLSLLAKDYYGVQNGLIYFWNLHLHVFRSGLYGNVMEEVVEFLKFAVTSIEALKAMPSPDPAVVSFDDCVRIALQEALVEYYEAKGQVPMALETAIKAANVPGTEYFRKKLCEMVARLTLVNQAAAGGKGGGKGVAEIKLDNPFLTLFSTIAQAEQPVALVPRDQSAALTDKAIAMMDAEVATFLKAQPWVDLTQERFSQLLELQCEAWARLTRLKILFGDVIGSQTAAEKCLALLSSTNMKEEELQHLSARVWRWVSICERLFGIAVTNIIQPEGQDIALQNDLRLLALKHFNLACDYGIKAAREELVVEAAVYAWNCSIPLIEFTELRERLFEYQRGIVNDLLLCKLPTIKSQVMELRQQFYLAMIEGYANVYDWSRVLSTVLEAFDNVSNDLQKPLWQWRVIAMSKKGKNVLDGLQKLKENDPSLQAQVYGILARASNNPKQQLESYLKAIEILQNSLERVDYQLEAAQWMASVGLPASDISDLLTMAMDGLYEVEERGLPEIADMDEEEAQHAADYNSERMDSNRLQSERERVSARSLNKAPGTVSAKSIAGKSVTASQVSKSKAGTRSVASNRSKGGAATPGEEDRLPQKLNFKQLIQSVHALVMLGSLETNAARRIDKNLEAVYFLRKSLHLWMDTLHEQQKRAAYHALTHEEREKTPYEAFSTPLPECLNVPAEPVLMLSWSEYAKPQFAELTAQAMKKEALCLPTAETLPAINLTVHYVMQLAERLQQEGFAKHALFCYAYLRMLLLLLTPAVAGREAALVWIQLNVVSLLFQLGLSDEAAAMIAVPLLPEDAALTYGAYITRYINNTAEKEAANAQHKHHEEQEEDYHSPFGIFPYSDAVDLGAINVPVTLLHCSKILLSMGQVPLTQSLLLTLAKQFTVNKQSRALVCASTLLSHISFLNGQYNEAIARILALRATLQSTGDALQVAAQTQTLMEVYVRTNKAEDAKEVALDLIHVLNILCVTVIDKKKLKDANRAAEHQHSSHTHSQTTFQPSSSTTVHKSASGNTIKMSRQSSLPTAKEEHSLDNLTALLMAAKAYLKVLLVLAKQAMSDGQDSRPIYVEGCELLISIHELAQDIAGNNSQLNADVLSTRAKFGLQYLLTVHQQGSSTIPYEGYSSWLADNVSLCQEYQSQAMEILKQLVQSIAAEDAVYANTALPISEEAKEGVTALPFKELSLPISRSLAEAQLSLSRILVVLAMLTGKHLSPTEFGKVPAPSVEQQYLADTFQAPKLQMTDFSTPVLYRASQLASAAMHLWRNTDGAALAEIAFAMSSLLRMSGECGFDAQWQQREIAKTILELPAASKEARDQFASLLRHNIEKGQKGELVEWSCLALVEAFGRNAPAKAACWLMQLQGLKASEWLQATWLSMLNPTTEAAASMERLDALNAVSWPVQSVIKQFEAERTFLKTVSVAYQRLRASTDPLSIISASPANTVYLCIQHDALVNCVYVSLGTKGGASAAPAAADKKAPAKPGAPAVAPVDHAAAELDDKHWVLDKILLTEDQRRLLQTLKAQHKVWLGDVTKFIATYSDNSTSEFDIEGAAAASDSKNMKKFERSLEERFRAMVADLESIFEPLLGEAGRFQAFVRALLEPPHAPPDKHAGGHPPAAAAAPVLPNLFILADPTLQFLPWEAVSIAELFKGRTSRDFSLHMLHNRQQSVFSPGGVPVPDQTQVSLSASNIRYIADPLAEDTGNKMEGLLREPMKAVVQSTLEKAPGGVKWTKVRDRSGLVSLQDWYLAMDATATRGDNKPMTGLMVSTLGRFGSLLAPTSIASMNLEKLVFLLCVDANHNDTSYRRQNSADVLKQVKEVENEMPLQMAAVLSLSGVGSLVTHAWSTPYAAQYRLLQQFIQAYCGKKERVLASLAMANNNIDSLPAHGGTATTATTATAGHAASHAAAAAAASAEERKPIKKWIRCARVLYGLPNVTYSE